MDSIKLAREVVAMEVVALNRMGERIGSTFEAAVELIFAAEGRVVIVGMGKSGIVGQKMAATLASTGTPAFFVHPGEAFHGDLGMIRSLDVVLLLSNSGETEEVIRLLPFLQYQKNKIISLTGNLDSTLAKNSNVVLDVSVEREACNNNLAPTSSTTATMVMGDALAIVLSARRNFKPEDFARFHPGGSLGRKLLTRVDDVMRKEDLPFCDESDSFKEVVSVINKGRLGLALVGNRGRFLGIITDGDIRRAFDRPDFQGLMASDILTKSAKTVRREMKLADAEELMTSNKVSSLVVVDACEAVVGVLQIYDLEIG